MTRTGDPDTPPKATAAYPPNDTGHGAESLEHAILQRAEAQASACLAQGERDRESILQQSSRRLSVQEERAREAAAAAAERAFRRKVQAREIDLQSALDRQRWTLVQSVFGELHARLERLHGDEAAYLAVFRRLLREAASAIEDDELTAAVNEADRRRWAGRWTGLVQDLRPGKTIHLAQEAHACTGGVVVSSVDKRLRVDNSFEGRLRRLEPILHRVILGKLLPEPVELEKAYEGR